MEPQASHLRATASVFQPQDNGDVDEFADEFELDDDFYTQVGDDDTLSTASEPPYVGDVDRVEPAATPLWTQFPANLQPFSTNLQPFPTNLQFRDHTYSTNVCFAAPTARTGLQEVLDHVRVGKVYHISYFRHNNTFEIQFFTHHEAITFLTQVFRREFKIRGHMVQEAYWSQNQQPMWPGVEVYSRSRIVDVWRPLINTRYELPCKGLDSGLMEIQYLHCRIEPTMVIQRLVYASVRHHSHNAFDTIRHTRLYGVLYGPDPCDPSTHFPPVGPPQIPFHITHHCSGRRDFYDQGWENSPTLIINREGVYRCVLSTSKPIPIEYGESSKSSAPSSKDASVTAEDAFRTLTISDDQSNPTRGWRIYRRATRGRGRGGVLTHLDQLNTTSSAAKAEDANDGELETEKND